MTFVENDVTYKGIATDITDTGQLIVQLENGQEKFLTAAKLVFLLGSRQDGFGKLADNISLTQTAKEQNPPNQPKRIDLPKNRIIKKWFQSQSLSA